MMCDEDGDDSVTEPECCAICGYEYLEDDDDEGVCLNCDMEMFALFSGLI